MKAEIISIGTELLMGQILNTNVTFLAREIQSLGFDCYHQSVVGDNPKRLIQAFEQASQRSDLVFMTGGLGPTTDDLTKAVLAKHIDEELILHQPSYDKMKKDFADRNRLMTDNNRQQALIPKTGYPFMNRVGQATGFAVEHEGTTYFTLPGPPHEMKTMFQEEVRPYISEHFTTDHKLFSRYLQFFGIGESQLVTEISDLIEAQTNPTIAPYASNQVVTIRLTAQAKSREEADQLIQDIASEILNRVGDFYFGEGEDLTLAGAVVEALLHHNKTLALAESLTGGMVASDLVGISGASNILMGSLVTYTKKAKQDILGVSKEILEEKGMISAACAESMAEQTRLLHDADFGLSFTGVAGPDKMEGHEVGTIFLGLAKRGQASQSKELHLNKTRLGNRQLSVASAFAWLLKELN